MSYLIVGIALIFLTVKGYCGKKLSFAVKDTGDACFFNFMRMLLCIAIGACVLFFDKAFLSMRLDWGMFAICLLSGLANAAFLVGWTLAIQKNSLVSVDVGLTLGSLIPAVGCAIFFAEPISLPKMVGYSLILAATVVLAGQSKQKGIGGLAGFLPLVIGAVGDGVSGFAQQIYKQVYTEVGGFASGVLYPKAVYHFYTYVFAAFLLFAVLLGIRISQAKGARISVKSLFTIDAKAFILVLVMAVCMFAANFFQTVATNDFGMSSQMLYPIVKGGCLITVNFTAVLCFNEKLTWRVALGSLIALGGIILMSVL